MTIDEVNTLLLKNGGPAFAVSTIDGYTNFGMSLRDYFAAAALPAILIHASSDAGVSLDRYRSGMEIYRGDYAKTAYQYADAMLVERSK